MYTYYISPCRHILSIFNSKFPCYILLLIYSPPPAVALGCAVQVGILDGDQALGGFQVLNPFQAAMMRAMAKQQLQAQEEEEDVDDEFDEGEILYEM